MTPFPIHDVDSAPAAAKPILQGAQKAMGFVPNMFGVLASAPAALEAYTSLAKLQDEKTAFDETERQVLFLSISARNECEYCVAAHTTISKGKGVSNDVVQAVREGKPLPEKLEALRAFALAVIETRGYVDDATRTAFHAAGYEERHALEVVLAVAFKSISNFSNHVAGTPLDAAFEPTAWSAGAIA